MPDRTRRVVPLTPAFTEERAFAVSGSTAQFCGALHTLIQTAFAPDPPLSKLEPVREPRVTQILVRRS